MLKGNQKLKDLGITRNGKLYFKDLGPQIGWTTVRFILKRPRGLLVRLEIEGSLV